MVTSKIIRRNKEFPKSVEEPRGLEKIITRGNPAPLMDSIREVIFKNPNCTQSFIKKSIPEVDGGIFRKAIRTMIEGHRIIQRFTIT